MTKKFSGRILVVDDNWISLKVMASTLESYGLVTTITDSGHDALESLKKEDFDLIFLDCSMPDVDGFAVARQIRSADGTIRSCPIIAFTGNNRDENRLACEEAGMNGLLLKPFSQTSLEDILIKYLPVV